MTLSSVRILPLFVWIAVVAAQSNIAGVYTVKEGSHYASFYWGQNGDAHWNVSVTFSAAAAEYANGTCFEANKNDYLDWNKLWGKARCGFATHHHADSDRFVWRRLQAFTDTPNCGGRVDCRGIQIA